MKIFLYLFAATAVFLFFSCKEKVTNPENETLNFSYESSKCLSFDLEKQALPSDSSFTYYFKDSLLIDFLAEGNCCPDSNRFTVSQNISIDTIYISVQDTALNLCDCICPYQIHVEFSNLPNDHYVVYCTLNSAGNDPIHIVDVYRSLGMFRSYSRQ
jgi:hypothetical protein